jgi:putative aldouronate transport system substrate-binding protein
MKKILLIVIALILMASVFAGCNSDNTQEEKETVTTKETQAAQEDATQAPEQETQEATELRLMLHLSSQIEADHPVIKALEEKTNTIITVEVPPYKNYDDRTKLMFASGDMVDAAFFTYKGHETEFYDLVDDGAVLPITQWVEQSENLLTYVDPDSWAGAKVKGSDEIYGVPGNTFPRIDGYAIREDWLEAVGLEMPEDNELTVDELNEILKRFTENDPDGNGVDDTYGITARSSSGVLSPLFEATFGVKGWDVSDGTYEYMSKEFSLEDDNYKKALAHIASLWEMGYIDPNWPSTESVSDIERFEQGIAGMLKVFPGHMTAREDNLLKNVPDAKVGYISLIRETEGAEVNARSPFGNNCYFLWLVTSAAAGKEEAIVRLLDYTVSDEGYDLMLYGVEGMHYNKVDGKVEVTDLYTENFVSFKGLTMPRRYNDARLFIAPTLSAERTENVVKLLNKAQSLVLPSLDMGFIPEAAREHDFIEYKSQLDEVKTKIILGELPVEAWDEALEGWYAAYGQQYVEEMNEFIKSNN